MIIFVIIIPLIFIISMIIMAARKPFHSPSRIKYGALIGGLVGLTTCFSTILPMALLALIFGAVLNDYQWITNPQYWNHATGPFYIILGLVIMSFFHIFSMFIIYDPLWNKIARKYPDLKIFPLMKM